MSGADVANVVEAGDVEGFDELGFGTEISIGSRPRADPGATGNVVFGLRTGGAKLGVVSTPVRVGAARTFRRYGTRFMPAR